MYNYPFKYAIVLKINMILIVFVMDPVGPGGAVLCRLMQKFVVVFFIGVTDIVDDG